MSRLPLLLKARTGQKIAVPENLTKIFRPLFGSETVGFWMLYQRLTKVVLKIGNKNAWQKVG